ncbi:uroporphyrinogen-III C-methyltransferase [Amorphus orientalis]|uniref:uroporphyrinogen-III C-methyltransferase n=1 Tax=Amorphus orientalis TaxID=649198 RepID=A0AAE3VP81_9HYPH|nr:uroporphyrinogen-III C-methyltransferase [Amorphus orientalis]MDQ0315676.1 uroporphyrin-III C-methyltransferase [Amorphus orientalis]
MTLDSLTPPFEPGTVWLAGAGPGDPGLLTIHTVNGLRRADAIVYDALVDKRVLELANPSATLDYAGKRGGKPSPSQSNISDRLIALARDGKRVLRLKGGDPFVFGRGGEEALALTEAGVRFRIIPGVSSGLAGIAVHGIPATTRDTNHAVVLATGHAADGEILEWARLARTGAPIVLYMAVAKMPAIVEGLVAGGMAPETTAVAVHAATMADEQVVETVLKDLPRLAADGTIRSPAVVAIGAIADFREKIVSHLITNRTPTDA